MKYNYVLGVKNPTVSAHMQTEQFKLSEILLDKRFEFGLSLSEMAKIAKVTEEKYLDMEYGETYISIESYQKAIDNINNYFRFNEKIDLNLKKATSLKDSFDINKIEITKVTINNYEKKTKITNKASFDTKNTSDLVEAA